MQPGSCVHPGTILIAGSPSEIIFRGSVLHLYVLRSLVQTLPGWKLFTSSGSLLLHCCGGHCAFCRITDTIYSYIIYLYYNQVTWYQCSHTTATRQGACLSPHMMRMISIEICSLPSMWNELDSLHQEKESWHERSQKGTRGLGSNFLWVHPAAFWCLCLPCGVTAPPHSFFIHTVISSARCWFLALMSTLVCYIVA